MKSIVIGFLFLIVSAADTAASPFSSTASADIVLDRFSPETSQWGHAFDLHSNQEGTWSAAAGLSPTPSVFAGGTASATGLKLEAYAASFFSFSEHYEGFARSAAELTLTDTLTIPALDARLQIDFRVSCLPDSRNLTGITLQVGFTHLSGPCNAATPSVITVDASSGSGPIEILIQVRANSNANGLVEDVGRSDVTVEAIRAYDSSRLLSNYKYSSNSGMQYPFQGGTLSDVPEPGTAALLIAGGVLAIVRLRAIRKSYGRRTVILPGTGSTDQQHRDIDEP